MKLLNLLERWKSHLRLNWITFVPDGGQLVCFNEQAMTVANVLDVPIECQEGVNLVRIDRFLIPALIRGTNNPVSIIKNM